MHNTDKKKGFIKKNKGKISIVLTILILISLIWHYFNRAFASNSIQITDYDWGYMYWLSNDYNYYNYNGNKYTYSFNDATPQYPIDKYDRWSGDQGPLSATNWTATSIAWAGNVGSDTWIEGYDPGVDNAYPYQPPSRKDKTQDANQLGVPWFNDNGTLNRYRRSVIVYYQRPATQSLNMSADSPSYDMGTNDSIGISLTLNPTITINGHHIAGARQNNNLGGSAYITSYSVDTTGVTIPVSSKDYTPVPMTEDISTGDNANTSDVTSATGTHAITINRSNLKVGVNKITFNGTFYVPIKCGQLFTDTSTQEVNTSLTVTVTVADNTPTTKQTVIVNYLNQATGLQIASSTVDTNPAIGVDTYTAITVPGYTLVGSNTQSVTVAAGGTYTLNFNYTANGGLPPPTTQSVTINYINKDNGNQITNPTIDNNPVIGNNTYTAKNFSDYTLVGSSTQTVNVAAGQNCTVNFYYTLNAITPDTYIITCYDERNGSVIGAPVNGVINLGQSLNIPAPVLLGYTLDTIKSPNPACLYGELPAGRVYYVNFYYYKIPSPPVITLTTPTIPIHTGKSYPVSVTGIDPQNDPLTYSWVTSDGQVITGTGGNLIAGSANETVTVYAVDSEGLKSNVCTGVIDCYNNPPTIILNVPSTALIGANIPVSAIIYDQDLDTISTVWSTPADMQGGPISNVTNFSGVNTINTTVYFNNPTDINKTYNFTVTATDRWGAKASQTASVTILPVTPAASLTLGGTQKENRLETLTASDDSGSANANIVSRLYQFYDSSGSLLVADSNPTSSNVVKALNTPSSLNNQSLQFLIKKAGTYTAKYTVTNNFGVSTIATQNIIVASDVPPTANFTKSGSQYANKNNTDSQGHALFTKTLTDNSVSNDGDTISHKIWLYCWDANNTGQFDDNWYVYSSGSWQPLSNFTADGMGTWDEIQNLDISKINDGNCASVTIQSPWVGNYYYYEITQESFGQPTISQLITNSDYRISDRTDISTMPTMSGN